MTNSLESSKLVKDILLNLLGEDGSNVLGIYELWTGTRKLSEIPSIKINYPQQIESFQLKIKPASGIECVINANPDTKIEAYHHRNFSSLRYWEIVLDQHHPTKGLIDTIEFIYSIPTIRPLESPLISNARELPNNEGILPARAIIYIPQKQFIYGAF